MNKVRMTAGSKPFLVVMLEFFFLPYHSPRKPSSCVQILYKWKFENFKFKKVWCIVTYLLTIILHDYICVIICELIRGKGWGSNDTTPPRVPTQNPRPDSISANIEGVLLILSLFTNGIIKKGIKHANGINIRLTVLNFLTVTVEKFCKRYSQSNSEKFGTNNNRKLLSLYPSWWQTWLFLSG